VIFSGWMRGIVAPQVLGYSFQVTHVAALEATLVPTLAVIVTQNIPIAPRTAADFQGRFNCPSHVTQVTALKAFLIVPMLVLVDHDIAPALWTAIDLEHLVLPPQENWTGMSG
jgi:hypothetical protein